MAEMVRTRIDRICDFISEKPATVDTIGREFGVKPGLIESIARTLEKEGVLAISYPPIGVPLITLIRKMPYVSDKEPSSYDDKISFNVSDVDIRVYVYRDDERRPFYHTSVPMIGPYTRIFLEALKGDIAKEVPLEAHYFLTPERTQSYLPEIKHHIRDKLASYFDESELSLVTGLLFIEMYGLGKLEIFMGDPSLEEIAINTSALPVAVYHNRYGWMKTNVLMPDEDSIANISSQIARRVGEQITITDPLLDAYLTTGDRAAATLFPISTRGNTITIRKFAREPWTAPKFIENHTASLDMLSFLWQAIHYEINIVMTGGTASGKTSMLNILTHLIPNFQRVVTIEETRELMLPEHIWNWVPLLTRRAGPEGKEITMARLLTTSLRLRPDRVILGEIRTREEAEVLFDAVHTGHSVCTTMHADTAAQLLKRLLEPPFSISATEVESLNLVVVQHRDRRRNLRRTFEISEIVPGVGGMLAANRLFMWRPRTDTFEMTNPPRRYIEDINLYTGLTEREIYEDMAERKRILEWMMKNGYSNIFDVGDVMRLYYNLHDELMEAVNAGNKLPRMKKSIPAASMAAVKEGMEWIKKAEDEGADAAREENTERGESKEGAEERKHHAAAKKKHQ